MSKLILSDWLQAVKKIENESMNLICIDPPYGKIMGLKLSGQKKHITWDIKIDWKLMFTEFKRIIKKGGTIIVFGQQPTYSEMILTNVKDFKYEYIWVKNNAAQGYHANKSPLIYTENIAVFVTKEDQLNKRTFNKSQIQIKNFDESKYYARAYSQKIQKFINLPRRKIYEIIGHRKLEFFFYSTGINFTLLSEELYNELIYIFKIDSMEGFVTYDYLKNIWKNELDFNKGIKFNSDEYSGTISNVLNFSKDGRPYYHPTQKPVSLLKYLISLYTNENDYVLDCFAGSGSTLIAAKQLNRRYIGVEIDQEFYEIAKKRLKDGI